MTMTRTAIALIGRTHPEIFDILGNPPTLSGRIVGRLAERASELNPQPLPPVDAGLRAGLAAGVELLRLANTSVHLGVAFEVDPDDWCPTPPRRPKFPPTPWPPQPWSQEDDDPRWLEGYYAGVVLSLEAGGPAFNGRDGVSDGLAKVHEAATAGVATLGG
jgi:hypothetical protein